MGGQTKPLQKEIDSMRSVITTLRRNAIAILALVVAMAGTAYAGTQLPAGSVGTKQLKKNAVTTKKIQDGAVTGSKINLSTLGTVPSAAFATKAGMANTANDANALQGHPATYFAKAGALHDVTVVRSSLPIGVGYHSGYANCPAGEVATGGGTGLQGGSYSGHYIYTFDSGPTNAGGNFQATTTGSIPTRWYGSVYNSSATDTAYVWALCAQQ
jgi:hypothetical protein